MNEDSLMLLQRRVDFIVGLLPEYERLASETLKKLDENEEISSTELIKVHRESVELHTHVLSVVSKMKDMYLSSMDREMLSAFRKLSKKEKANLISETERLADGTE